MISDKLKTSIDGEYLLSEQADTLGRPRRRYGFLARMLFFFMDLFYGKKRSLPKFKVLEVIARVPYQAWENVAYVAMTHTYKWPDFARRIFEFVRESRYQQDNEQWHLLIIEERLNTKRIPQGFWLPGVLPQVAAFFYYHVSWILYVVKPDWSYALNADFEDHAEHEYMEYVSENTDFETEAFESSFANDYGRLKTWADFFRRVGLDERVHKEESLMRMGQARFK